MAVVISFTLTDAEAARAAAALGKIYNYRDGSNNPRPATMAEAKAFVVNTIKGVVLQQERREQEAAITETPFSPT